MPTYWRNMLSVSKVEMNSEGILIQILYRKVKKYWASEHRIIGQAEPWEEVRKCCTVQTCLTGEWKTALLSTCRRVPVLQLLCET
jgi:hypothetical protein